MSAFFATMLAAGALAASAPMSGPPALAPADGAMPAALREVDIQQNIDKDIPLDLEFKDENGESVQLSKYFKEKPVIITPVYFECPMLCNMVLNGVVKTLRVLPFAPGKEFDILTVSFDPRETATLAFAKKGNYIQELGNQQAADGWHFLTGNEQNIRALMDSLGFKYTFDEARGEYAHAAGIMLLTPTGKISRYFYGSEFSPRDLRLGIVEASQGKVGTLAESLILFCYKYDPLTSKYGLMTMRLVRIGGALTILALGTFMFVMFRRDFRQQRAGA